MEEYGKGGESKKERGRESKEERGRERGGAPDHMSKLSQSAFIWDSFILIEEKRLEKKVLSIYCSENSEKIVINQAMRDKAVSVCECGAVNTVHVGSGEKGAINSGHECQAIEDDKD